MSWFQHIIDVIRGLFQWWFIVLPWEQGVRIRLGKHVKQFGDGVHMQIPFIDRVYIQNTRMRIASLSPQTLTTADGKTITCAGSLRYRVKDVMTLYRTLHQAEETIKLQVEGLLADYIIRHNLPECSPCVVSDHVTAQLDLSRYGLNDTQFFLTDFAVVKTFRLIGGNMERYNSGPLETTSYVRAGRPA
ncbi:MAG TPA: SPFH domain-containing protein [Steroidobacteraceae bacterium]